MAGLPERLVDVDEQWPADLTQAVHDELVWLWADLYAARREAVGGCWSTGCEMLVHRIVALSRLTGAIGWTEVDVALVRSGLYERIHREAGLEHLPIDWDRLAGHERSIQRSGSLNRRGASRGRAGSGGSG